MVNLSHLGLSTLGNGPIYDRPASGPRNTEIFYILSEFIKPSIILEIGTWEGRSAMSWADANNNSTIICVDTWLGSTEHYENGLAGTEWGRERLFLEDGYPSIYKTFVSNIRRFGSEDRTIAIPIDSRQAFIMLKKSGIVPDITYIDAAHDYQSVYDDLCGAASLGQTLICGDDYYSYASTQIKEAVDFFADENDLVVLNKENQFVLLNNGTMLDNMRRFGWNDR